MFLLLQRLQTFFIHADLLIDVRVKIFFPTQTHMKETILFPDLFQSLKHLYTSFPLHPVYTSPPSLFPKHFQNSSDVL